MGKVQEHIRIKHIIYPAEFLPKCWRYKCYYVCQCDFAMAYSCSYQNEIQPALWSKQSVNLFTVALYQSDMPCKSSVLATKHKDKGKVAVYTYLMKIVISVIDSDIGEKLIIYPDGPTSEIKNKFTLENKEWNGKRIEMYMWGAMEIFCHFSSQENGWNRVWKVKSVVRERVLSKNKNVVQNATQTLSMLQRNTWQTLVEEMMLTSSSVIWLNL